MGSAQSKVLVPCAHIALAGKEEKPRTKAKRMMAARTWRRRQTGWRLPPLSLLPNCAKRICNESIAKPRQVCPAATRLMASSLPLSPCRVIHQKAETSSAWASSFAQAFTGPGAVSNPWTEVFPRCPAAGGMEMRASRAALSQRRSTLLTRI